MVEAWRWLSWALLSSLAQPVRIRSAESVGAPKSWYCCGHCVFVSTAFTWALLLRSFTRSENCVCWAQEVGLPYSWKRNSIFKNHTTVKVGVTATEHRRWKADSFAQLCHSRSKLSSLPQLEPSAGATSAGMLTMNIWANTLSPIADRPYYSQANWIRACKGDWGQTLRYIYIN